MSRALAAEVERIHEAHDVHRVRELRPGYTAGHWPRAPEGLDGKAGRDQHVRFGEHLNQRDVTTWRGGGGQHPFRPQTIGTLVAPRQPAPCRTMTPRRPHLPLVGNALPPPHDGMTA